MAVFQGGAFSAQMLPERVRRDTIKDHLDGELSVSERNFFNKFKLAYQRLTSEGTSFVS
jgi:hypothetical protein